MADFVNTIDLYGDEIVAGKLVDKTIDKYNDDTIALIGDYAFSRCSNLTSVDLPNATSIGDNAFSYCTNLASVVIPNVTSSDYDAFYRCSNLTSVDLPKVTSIASSMFSSCSKLTTIILRSPTVCTLANTSAFNGTPFASNGTGGTVYVPQALIEQYKTATNWSSLYSGGKCNFVAIEGSEYE